MEVFDDCNLMSAMRLPLERTSELAAGGAQRKVQFIAMGSPHSTRHAVARC